MSECKTNVSEIELYQISKNKNTNYIIKLLYILCIELNIKELLIKPTILITINNSNKHN